MQHLIDQVNNANEDTVRRVAYAMVNAMDSADFEAFPGEKLVAITTLYAAVCQVSGVAPSKLLEVAGYMQRDASGLGWKPQFRALQDYVREEVCR